jgi:gamma-glutamyl:cysteine ligase YbdK (ATP-grasp superfamily)
VDANDFAAGGEFAVGAEEELQLVDGDNQPCSGGAPALVQHLAAQPRGRGTVSTELSGAEIEFATSICTDAGAVRQDPLISVLRWSRSGRPP